MAVLVIVTARSEATLHEVNSGRKTLVDAEQPPVGPTWRWQQKRCGGGGRGVGVVSVTTATTEARRRRLGLQQRLDLKLSAKIQPISPKLALKLGPSAWRPGVKVLDIIELAATLYSFT
uniref:Uncharacterized protein n=1 Tax=Opuntia streptacantha TaxID=393608 RepID=A0A7C8YQK9_OPUST